MSAAGAVLTDPVSPGACPEPETQPPPLGHPPSVSIVVPVWNAASEIGRLLESLLRLDWPRERLEILIVDNASTDGTAGVVRRYPVVLLQERRVQSSYAARNRGVEAAKGEWVAFTDSDCVAPRDWLGKLLPPPAKEIGAVAGEVSAFELRTPVQRLTERFGIIRHAVTLPHKGLPCFSTANVAIRRRLLVDLRGFRQDVRFFADMELSWRMQIESGASILFRPQAVILHRHRRTFRDLFRHGRQHGRGVAFMRRAFPDRYRIRPPEQAARLAAMARAAWSAAAGSLQPPDPDRFHAPLFLIIWYAGMCAGYMMGPARSRDLHPTPGAAAREVRKEEERS